MTNEEMLWQEIRELKRQLQMLRYEADTIPRRPPKNWNSWSPSFSGFSTAPSGGIYLYKLDGDWCTCVIMQPNNGTSNANYFYMSAPLKSKNRTNAVWMGFLFAVDNGSAQSTVGAIHISPDVGTFTLYKDAAGAANWTTSGGKRARFATITYEIAS